MKTWRLSYVLLWLSLIPFGISCSKFRKIEKSDEWNIKYKAAIKYYEHSDYYRSALLFEQIRPLVRGLPEGERVEFLLAYCRYYEKAYLLASGLFKLFYETYGRSESAEEARFMYAYSLYASSPSYSLDQQGSIEAMFAMQNFINQYPNSPFAEQATQIIDACQKKLEQKGYENTKLYLKLERYKAAITAIETYEQNFPTSQYLEEVALLKLEAQYKLSLKSLPYLRKERFQKTITFYEELVDEYPNSTYLKEAEKYYIASMKELHKTSNKS